MDAVARRKEILSEKFTVKPQRFAVIFVLHQPQMSRGISISLGHPWGGWQNFRVGLQSSGREFLIGNMPGCSAVSYDIKQNIFTDVTHVARHGSKISSWRWVLTILTPAVECKVTKPVLYNFNNWPWYRLPMFFSVISSLSLLAVWDAFAVYREFE